MTRVVLDSSAVLAVLNAEPGAEIVIGVLDDAALSTVSYAEVIAKLMERGSTLAEARSALTTIDVRVVDFDIGTAEQTGALRPATRHLGLSLADRACLALAAKEGVAAITGDRKWTQVPGIDVLLIR